ncbi:MAG: V-type ATP synthase subunit E [Crenarchaeota archaeon]|nr:MAG: V-type ATP synthase subunit E [Thermoproteota archaeon]RDJ34529.1 MAG: V-type ATP synthase subunit E [Thermoproteota archaeon]RDJ35951.1 MAG: V-type ATP synthase subunit E [Thermoproteota archaeon]RDJ38528.1 MAG: V-type ATP synthase subunit E [Thermoproteota archaeon]
MALASSLERTIDKILDRTENDALTGLKESLEASKKTLDDSIPKLQQEYDKIINDGKKEAEKLEKQIVGSSDLEMRNKQIVLVEEAIERAFAKATDQIKNTKRDENYTQLITKLIEESTKILGTSEITVYSNSTDKEIIQKILPKFSGAQLAPESINCLGGIKVKSKNGAMTFDNTLNARLERMKPLIRKEIATQFGLGN